MSSCSKSSESKWNRSITHSNVAVDGFLRNMKVKFRSIELI